MTDDIKTMRNEARSAMNVNGIIPRFKSEHEARQAENKSMITGNWGKWEKFQIQPGSFYSDGWLKDITEVYRNDFCSVLVHEIKIPIFGNVIHAALTKVSHKDFTWAQKQRIKNEIFGDQSYAVEVFPERSQVVDGANMYHLWILPHSLPFSLMRL